MNPIILETVASVYIKRRLIRFAIGREIDVMCGTVVAAVTLGLFM